ncbi:hypothetical protein B5G20_07560, partial [Collinsella sp. An7]|uniref:InlB B-repeat-containing protein n=1 Tax=Collinsella sp. An7 TaxID=1965651 RepID=UPI000B584CE4
MHVPQKLRKELKRKGTKALAFFLAFVLAVQCMNLPVIVAAATDAAGNALATVEDTPSNDQATSAATDQAADQAATETEQPATEQAPVEQPATEQAPVEQPAEPAEPAEPATEEPAATEAPAADQPAESTTPAGSENVTEGGASENGQAPVAPAADTTATVALSLAQSTLTVGADTYTATDKTMEAPANQELKFSVVPEGGFAVKTVKQIAADHTETELSADASGTYTVAPEAVADGLEIKVETEEAPAAEEQPAEEAPAEEPATDESTDETTEPAEDEAATEEPAEDETTADDEQTPADEATEDEAVEEAMPDASNGISTLSISGQKQVAIGETIRLSSDSPASSGGWRPQTYTHKWTASPSNAVSFSNTSNSGADVTGKRAGTVTINHEWGYNSWGWWQKEGSETYTITVYQADEEDFCTITFDTNGGNWNNSLKGTHKFVMGHELWPEGQDLSVPTRNGYVFEGWTPAVSRVVSDDATYTAQWKPVKNNLTPVYVYLKVNGDTSGLILNYSGWYTVGVIYMPSNLVPNTGLYQDQTVNLNNQRVAQALDEAMKGIVRYGPNESLVIDDATWTKLHVQAGANDYVAEGSAWHLDGEIDAKYLANLTVNHIDMDTRAIMRTDTSVRTVGTSVNPGDMVRSFKNYTYDHSEPNHAITIQKNGENVINIYYQKNGDRLFYDANGGQGTMLPSLGKAEEQVDVKPNEFTRDGYEFTGWNTEDDGSGIDYKPGDKYTLTDGKDCLYAQWKQVVFEGDAITVKLKMDGKLVPVGNTVRASEYTDGGGTDNFKVEHSGDNLRITYTYTNLNCADIALDIDVPEGYDVQVESDKTNETVGKVDSSKVAQFKLNGSGENWTLDNTPGGATVTVKLTKKEFTVSYKADNGGRVSEDSETVRYGADAKGSTATPSEGYYFVNWTDEDGNEVSTDAEFAPKSVKENATYTAHFAKKMEVSITGKSATDLVYNGSEQSVSGFVGEAADGVPVNVDGQTYYVKGATSTASGTNAMDEAANTTVNTDKVQVVDANGNDVTDRFTVTVSPGQFKINKRVITVTDSKSVPYSGSEQALVIGEGDEGQYKVDG